MFTVSLFTVARVYKHPRSPATDEQTKKLCGIHTQWDLIQSFLKKKSEIIFARKWERLE